MDPGQLFMVFDVESIGLHGEGFAVGYVIVRSDGEVPYGQIQKRYACRSEMAAGDDDGHRWVGENCPNLPTTHTTAALVRDAFWRDWLAWKECGAVLVADCAWPVEARFLAACVDDDPSRAWDGPYPLHELASFMAAAGFDPLGPRGRHNDELPEHDPLADARQSARLLVTALGVLEVKRARAV